MADPTPYANAWLALLPQVFLPTMAAQAVARECARYADWQTGANVRPGQALLAENLNCSTDTVKRATAVLVDHELLRQESLGGMVHGRPRASVYQLTVPAHLATEEALARFPDPSAVQVVKAAKRGRAKHLQEAGVDPEETPGGRGCPPGNPTDRAPRVAWVHPSGGRGCTPEGGAGAPSPSIDPPVTLQTPRADTARPMTAAQDDAKDDDARTAEEVAADGLRLVRQALGDRPRRGGDGR